MLQDVEWGEYRLGDLFDSSNGDFDIQKSHINDKGNYVITSGLTNNGILGKTDITARIFEKGSITVDMFGYAFYRQFDYKMVTHARVFSLQPKFNITSRQGLFIVSTFNFISQMFGFDNMCTWDKIKNTKIKLPMQNGKIDFDFMESFIAELEAERIAELEAYLLKTGLKNCNLTEKERDAINKLYLGVEWSEFRIGSLFEKIQTKKLPYKAKNLPKIATGKYTLPCLTSSFQNQGLNYFVPKEGSTVLKNVISIPSNSDVYRAYFQSEEFTVLSDAYAIRWKSEDFPLSQKQYLFMVQCINKVTDLPIFSYKNKLGGWNVVKDLKIKLPVKDGEIDFSFMEIFISAMQKIIIKDVVSYADKKIEAAKMVTFG